MADILRGGSGVACTLVPVADPPGGVRIHLEVDGGNWSLDGAPPFSVLDDPLPRWLRFAIPDGGWIGPVEITGTIVEPWLEARQEHLQGE